MYNCKRGQQCKRLYDINVIIYKVMYKVGLQED